MDGFTIQGPPLFAAGTNGESTRPAIEAWAALDHQLAALGVPTARRHQIAGLVLGSAAVAVLRRRKRGLLLMRESPN